jgi:hypothetical protein
MLQNPLAPVTAPTTCASFVSAEMLWWIDEIAGNREPRGLKARQLNDVFARAQSPTELKEFLHSSLKEVSDAMLYATGNAIVLDPSLANAPWANAIGFLSVISKWPAPHAFRTCGLATIDIHNS